MYYDFLFFHIYIIYSSLNYSGGKRVLLALIPVIKISTAFRDQTILVIRKALFSPRIETRRIAINGVLALLKYFKISSGALSNTSTQTILSQSSSGLRLSSSHVFTIPESTKKFVVLFSIEIKNVNIK